VTVDPDLENLAHTLVSNFSMCFSPRYDRNCFRILYIGIFILFGVCVCVCGSFGASDVILILMVRLGPCPGINVIGKTGRALNVESR